MENNCINQGSAGGHRPPGGLSCRYRFFNRHAGISAAPYDSMNVSYGVGDREKAVAENRSMVEEISGFPVLLSARQIHGNGIFCLTEPLVTSLEVESVDALITDQRGVGLMIQQADCQAVLLFDPEKQIAAAVHCGWRGSAANILDKVVCCMKTGFGVDPGQLQAVVSPSLGPCCAEFVHYRDEFPGEFVSFMVRPDYFDFWQISKHQLLNAGLAGTKISVAGICTCCSSDYFSYRRASRLSNGVTGRNCSIIGMENVD